jgi:hypothetical protein
MHVEKVAKRAGQQLAILRKAKKVLDVEGLATIFKTRVRSIMEYCGPIWQGAPKAALSKLDIIQRRACKIMGINQDVVADLNLQSLAHRRNISGLCQIHRMVSNVAPHGVCELLPCFRQPVRNSRCVMQSHHFQLNVPRSKTEHHMKSFVPCFSRCWNGLPNDCIYNSDGGLKNLQSFKVAANRWFLNMQ